jgi:hypothetical protein
VNPQVSPSSAPAATTPVCAPGSVRVGLLTAVGNASSALVAGSVVRFTLELTSSSSAACVFVPALDLTITSGDDRIWTSADCPVAAVGGPGVTAGPTLAGTAQTLLIPGGVQLGGGSSASLDLVWPGVRSAGSCTAAPSPLSAGTYVASVTIADTGSTGTAFSLH